MAAKPDHWIRKMALEKGMIEPFQDGQVRGGVISYGLSSYGYDFRVGREFRVLRPRDEPMDPKKTDPTDFEVCETDVLTLPPHSYALAQTVEYFRIPRNTVTICFGKSTYARSGIFVNITPFEPEWEGFATIAIMNPGARSVKIYAEEGIAQLLFLEGDEVCETSYADKKGKYQAQTEITHAKVE